MWLGKNKLPPVAVACGKASHTGKPTGTAEVTHGQLTKDVSLRSGNRRPLRTKKRWKRESVMKLETSFRKNAGQKGRVRATANDLKLSEPRGWRDRCAAGGEGGRPEAAGVTAARVRCSAWLGVAVIFI